MSNKYVIRSYERRAVDTGNLYKDSGQVINIASILKDVFADQAGRSASRT